MDVGTTHEWSVKTVAMPKDKINDEIPAIPCRLIALRRTEESAELARAKLRRESRKKGHTPSKESLETAAYIFVLTTVPASEMSIAQCLEIFRFRWQIELAFKNLKSVIGLTRMEAKSRDLCLAYISSAAHSSYSGRPNDQ